MATDTGQKRGDEHPTAVAEPQEGTPAAPLALRLAGSLPADSWNRLGTRLIPKLRSGDDLHIEVSFQVTISAASASALRQDLLQALQDLGLEGAIEIREA